MRYLHMLWLHLESHISFPTIKLWSSGKQPFFGCGRKSAEYSAEHSAEAGHSLIV